MANLNYKDQFINLQILIASGFCYIWKLIYNCFIFKIFLSKVKGILIQQPILLKQSKNAVGDMEYLLMNLSIFQSPPQILRIMLLH